MSDGDLEVIGGGCLCGAVRYEVRSPQREGYYCHCRMCQLAFGNTRAAFVNLAKDEVRWLREPAYYASSRIARRGFCARCGSPVSFEYLDSKRMDLAVGGFDDPSLLRPTLHFAIETRLAGWHAEDDLPGERYDDNPALVGRWKAAYGDAAEPGLATVRSAAGGPPGAA